MNGGGRVSEDASQKTRDSGRVSIDMGQIVPAQGQKVPARGRVVSARGLVVPTQNHFSPMTAFGLFLLALLPAMGWCDSLKVDASLPFQPGERLTYKLRWTVIPAGKAVLEVHPMTNINGVPAYHFVLTAKTTPFIDRIYKVRDRIEGFADAKMTGSMLYKKKQREGSVRKDILVVFDTDSNQARYYKSGKIHKELPISMGTFDPLSIFYYSRSLELKENSTFQKPVSDGKRWVIGKAHVVRRECITLDNGNSYDTFLMEPDLSHVGGVFEKSKDAKLQVWVTADRQRIPVKVKSAVVIGSFTGELIAAQGLRPTNGADENSVAKTAAALCSARPSDEDENESDL
jgi:hypothetical protein